MWQLNYSGLVACFNAARGSDFLEELGFITEICDKTAIHTVHLAHLTPYRTVYVSIGVRMSVGAPAPSVDIDLWLDLDVLLEHSILHVQQSTGPDGAPVLFC